jgi:NitT/TauT family transport system permease protein
MNPETAIDLPPPVSATAAPRAKSGTRATRWVRTGAIGLIVPTLLLTLWWVLVRWTGTALVPTPAAVGAMMWDFAFGGIYDDAFSATLGVHLLASMRRVFAGFGLAAVTGVPLGLLLGRSTLVRMLLDPLLALLRPIPVTAWLPLAMIFFGLGSSSAIFLVFLGAFYPIMLNTVFGVRSIDPRLFEAAAMLGCTGAAQFRSVTLRAALPSIFTGLRMGLSFAWILIVVGEMTGVELGLGAVIMDARTLSRTDLVMTGMIVIGVAGFLCDRVIVAINNRCMRWSPQHHE